MLVDACLQAQRVLVDIDQLPILQQGKALRRKLREVATDEQRTAHHAPHAEVGLILCVREAFALQPAFAPHADDEHVHVVVVTVAGISREIEVLADDVFERVPVGLYVSTDPPGASELLRPCSGEGPAADVELHVGPAILRDGAGNRRVTTALIHAHRLRSAVVDLDEVEVPITKIALTVGCLMAVQTGDVAIDIVVPHRSTGTCAGIGIDTSLQPERMDIARYGKQTVGEALPVGYDALLLIPITEEAIVDVHILVTQRAQA